MALASVAKKSEEPSVAATATPKLPDYKPGAAELKAIKDLEALGVAVRPIAMNLGWQDVNFRAQSSQAVDKMLVPLRGVLGAVELIPATNEIVQEFADLLAVIASAAADNQITPKEAASIRARWEELKTVTEGSVACCEEGNFSALKNKSAGGSEKR